MLWAYARDLYQTPGFGDTVDFGQIKEHYYVVHADINPTRVVPKGPDLSGWGTVHGREKLGGRPFGDGTRRDRRGSRNGFRILVLALVNDLCSIYKNGRLVNKHAFP